jgi:hypothetical protein
MVNAITQFFIQHRDVVLPGIGQLKAIHNPARYDAAQQMMFPPGHSFQWIPADEGSNGSLQTLMAYLSRKNQWTEEESFEAMNGFCRSVQESISTSGEWFWPGLGKLVSLNKESIGFVPETLFQQYHSPLVAERAIHSGRSHQMLVGDKETSTAEMQEVLTEEDVVTEGKWWVPALIVGVITLFLILARLSGWI